MAATAFKLFDTPLGSCGIAWNAHGICGFQLPEHSEQSTLARMHRRFAPAQPSDDPPPEVKQTIAAVLALMNGERLDLLDVRLDLEGVPPFHRRVYELARQIPPGQTLTYGELAARLGDPAAARAVGQALGANPIAVIVPCHRVMAAGGRSGGFSAPGGVSTKFRLLTIEGAQVPGSSTLFAD